MGSSRTLHRAPTPAPRGASLGPSDGLYPDSDGNDPTRPHNALHALQQLGFQPSDLAGPGRIVNGHKELPPPHGDGPDPLGLPLPHHLGPPLDQHGHAVDLRGTQPG